MKKLLAILLIAALTFTFAACAKTAPPEEASTQEPRETVTAPADTDVLCDTNGLVVRGLRFEAKKAAGTALDQLDKYYLRLENGSGRDLHLELVATGVNGCAVETLFNAEENGEIVQGMSLDVSAGQTTDAYLTFNGTECALYRIDAVRSIEFLLRASEPGPDSAFLFLSDPVIIRTGVEGEQTYDDAGTVVGEAEGVKLVVLGLDPDADQALVNVLVVNNSDRPVRVEAVSAVADGAEVEPWYSETVAPGQRCVSRLSFFMAFKAIGHLEATFRVREFDYQTGGPGRQLGEDLVFDGSF